MNHLDIINNILAPLIVATITSIGTWILCKYFFKRRLNAAPRIYIHELDKLICRAVREGESGAMVNGRAIVAMRNSLRDSLLSMAKQLNSEIDTLSLEIGLMSQKINSLETANKKQSGVGVYQTILVLYRVWPAKRKQIEVEMRKLLVELGLPVNNDNSSEEDADKDFDQQRKDEEKHSKKEKLRVDKQVREEQEKKEKERLREEKEYKKRMKEIDENSHYSNNRQSSQQNHNPPNRNSEPPLSV